MQTIDLRVWTQGGYHTFVAKFSNVEQAISYIERKSSDANFALMAELDQRRMSEEEGAVWDHLNPRCEHGLSLSLCAGPGHYPQDDPRFDY